MQIKPLTPPAPLDAETLAALAELDRLRAELDALRPLDPTAEGRVLQKLRLDWNYHSNAIEGNQLSQGETRALLMHGLTAHGKPLKDHNEIKGHNEVIEWLEAVVRNQEPLTEAMLREFHKRLLVEAYELDALTPDGQPSRRRIEPGTYKTQPNHVQTATGAIHYYADPAEVPALMGDLMAWYRARSEQRDLHPVIVAAELHYWFVAIHPFDDGNGRLSRILLNLELMRHGYPIAVIRTADKPTYLTALETADATSNLVSFYRVIIESVSRSTGIMIKAAKGEEYREPDEADRKLELITLALDSKFSKIKLYNSNDVINHSLSTLYETIPHITEKHQKIHQFFEEKANEILLGNSSLDNQWNSSFHLSQIKKDNNFLNTLTSVLNNNFGYKKIQYVNSLLDFKIENTFSNHEFKFNIRYEKSTMILNVNATNYESLDQRYDIYFPVHEIIKNHFDRYFEHLVDNLGNVVGI